MPSRLLESIRAALHQLGVRVGRKRRPFLVSREAIEELVGQNIQNLALYEQALKHRSLLRNQPGSHLASNERLEFLGDAVLGFIVAEYLYAECPDKDEGFLTRLRAKLVNGQALAGYAEGINLGRFILMSENMAQSDGRQNQTLLADAFEAIIGALYLDQGLEAARTFIQRAILDEIDLDELSQQHDNYKSLLLEYAQAQQWPQPQYVVTHEEGPSHNRIFTVQVLVQDRPCGTGTANSKKKAEQRAAAEALRRLRAENTPAGRP